MDRASSPFFSALSSLLVVLAACGGSSASDVDASSEGGTSGAGASSGGASSGSSGSAASSSSGGAGAEKFSFFVTSYKALQELSGSADGFGGDLRFGETGPGAGLRGADEICATIAEKSMPGAGSKTWRAFLSASDDGEGNVVHAIDRIGEGPWYDRLGRLFGSSKSAILATRPSDADAAIKNDFPNEDGVPNHQPDPNKSAVDNHDMLTGSTKEGKLYAANATCLDWTAKSGNTTTEGKPRVGHSWPRSGGGGPGGGGPGGGGPGGGGPGGGGNIDSWMSSLTEAGCAPGVNLVETGGPRASDVTVGSGGGYGGFYCFALTP